MYFQNVVFSAGLFDFLAMGFASVYAKRSEAVKYQMMACIVNERNTGAISPKKALPHVREMVMSYHSECAHRKGAS